MSASLLIVEDHQALSVAIAATAERHGLRTALAPTLARARQLLHRETFTGILLDIGLPDGHGLELVEDWQWPQRPQIAVITAHGEIETAIAARRAGIARFFDKPLNFEELHTFFDALTASTTAPDSPAPPLGNPSPFVGASPAMRQVFRQISHACASTQPVVIRGATGSGKTHVARLIQQSTGGDSPHPGIHASSRLDEAQLGAALHEASRAPLIIESIPSLTPALQSYLLHELDQLGPNAPRLIVTTDERPLITQVTDGSFNQDLYYRLQILEICLPPLCKRLDDIPAISACFLGELDERTSTRIDPEVLEIFSNYDWPGNLRELRNVINYALVTSAGAPCIDQSHIPSHLADVPPHHAGDTALSHAIKFWVDQKMADQTNYKELSTDLETLLLQILLDRFDGKPSRLAAALSINRSTLRKKLKHASSEDH